jgi:hypothetical protein
MSRKFFSTNLPLTLPIFCNPEAAAAHPLGLGIENAAACPKPQPSGFDA